MARNSRRAFSLFFERCSWPLTCCFAVYTILARGPDRLLKFPALQPSGFSLMVRKNYYLTLGISRNESTEGIRQAFREIVKRYHPDRVGSERLHFFQEIVEAYHVLADPERRSHYDQGLYHAGVKAGAPPPVFVGVGDPGDLPQATSVLRILSVKDAPFEAALARVSGSLTGIASGAKES